MNRKMIIRTVGLMLQLETVLLALPAVTALIYGEKCIWAILITMAISACAGGLIYLFCKPKDRVIYAREGFVIVALTWLVLSAVGALPFFLSGEIPNYIDAFFETVSGFTTTGASILTNVEAMSHGLLFWRSFTHWIGGMGVLVFLMALVPGLSDRSIHIMRAEMPGPVIGKLMPRAKDTASILYKIYIAMTGVEIILLLCGGMPFFDSLLHAFGTAGTGGFGIKCDSITGYSPYLQWVIAIFMLLFGVNFNLYYLLLAKRWRAALQGSEVWYYFGIVGVSVLFITLNILPIYQSIGTALRHATFQVSSIITTTGYATADFNLWPSLSKTIIVLLMIVGACAGSTGGGLKVSRAVMLCKSAARELKRMLHPHSVAAVRFEGKIVDDTTLKSVSSYFVMYVLIILSTLLLVSFNGFDLETNLTATLSCVNNIGPGLAGVGPTSSFAAYNGFSKLIFSLAMLLGRLEIIPLVLCLSPRMWRNK